MMFTHTDLLELTCLANVARISELPEGVSVSCYERLGYVEVRYGVLALTDQGRHRCAELQVQDDQAGAAMSLPIIAA